MVLLILEYFSLKVNNILKILRNYYYREEVKDNLLYNNVKKICEERGISILALEKALKFPRSSICKWNENEPGIRKVQKVADYLGVSIEELLAEEGE